VIAIFDPRPAPNDKNELRLQLVSDQVMGGVSRGHLDLTDVRGRPALRLTGDVSLERGGGFLQMAGDLPLAARGATGVRLLVCGNGETYGCHLRTTDVTRPWQSYRHRFEATAEWRTVDLCFADFVPHRIEAPLNVEGLTRLGLVAIGRAFHVDLAVGRIDLIGVD
jgi:hypothetical protein